MNQEVLAIVNRLKKLQELGFNREATWKVFEEASFPLGLHLYISGNWTKLGLK
jgi:hypothetical protein